MLMRLQKQIREREREREKEKQCAFHEALKNVNFRRRDCSLWLPQLSEHDSNEASCGILAGNDSLEDL